MRRAASRSHAVKTVCLALLCVTIAACGGGDRDFTETSIAELHDQFQRGELSSEELVEWYVDRVAAIDRSGPQLNAIIEINPDAISIARALDSEWRTSGPRGPLHGIPVVLKANIDTADQMYTSAGSLALADHAPTTDAYVVKRLRDAGAVVLGKANLSEWANFRSSMSSSGWSSVGGQTRNPYDTARSPCGSSSGSAVAVAANLTVVAIGTETDGSVVCPSGINGIVGIKPTLGLVSRSGIIPIAHSQDTAGPMARSVRDAAMLLTIMTGVDADDPATANAEIHHNYSSNLTADGLREKRIGVIRSYHGAGSNPAVDAILDSSVAALEKQGAEIVDKIEYDIANMYEAEYEVLLYEFRADLNHYLDQSQAPIQSLADLIAFNDTHAATVMPIFGQDIFLAAEKKGPLTDPEYLEALATSKRLARAAIDNAMKEHGLDAIVAPTNGPAWMIDPVNGDNYGIGSSSLAAISGYPSVTVPAGFISRLPIGLSFIGKAWNEKQLIEIAYAFEQATGVRQAPNL
ncbi:MAG: amidase [Gammaproteobacteria bacterium]|nr:amidase [Gammaproteobacteria bacterium]MBU2678326.1 amidase [Gammaproteobacteria bacterium]NNC56129.1 amidase [Woeseiaceae bacterium]NNL52061.1 amidase [Woeseiaceae bacterium]